MKSNILALMSAAFGFTAGGLITYKLLNRRRRPALRSFREIYEDNSVDFNDDGLFEDESDSEYIREMDAAYFDLSLCQPW